MEIFQSISLNFFLLNTLLFLYMLYFHVYRWQPRSNHYFLVVLFSIGTLLSYMFPLCEAGGIVIDLRLVPMILAGLYGGWRGHLAISLGVLPVIYLLNPEFKFFIVLPIVIAISFLFGFISPAFMKQKLKQKLVTGGAIGAALFGMVLWLPLSSVMDPAAISFFTGLNAFGIASMIVFIEYIHKQQFLMIKTNRIEKMEVASQLAACVSHEINNPLTASRGFLKLLKNADLTQEERNRYVDIAVEEMDQAVSVIREYLTFAIPVEESMNVINVREEIEHAAAFISPFAKETCTEIMMELEDCLIVGDAAKLKQAMINVMKNGIEAMESGGELRIKSFAENGKIHIHICDMGSGMTAGQISRLGEPYYSTKEKGTGLGMMVTCSIIKALKGDFFVASELGKGTSIRFSFPEAGM